MDKREFGVRLVEDDELPEEVDWTVATSPCQVLAIVKRSKVSEKTLADAWVAFRQQQGERGARAMGLVAAILPFM